MPVSPHVRPTARRSGLGYRTHHGLATKTRRCTPLTNVLNFELTGHAPPPLDGCGLKAKSLWKHCKEQFRDLTSGVCHTSHSASKLRCVTIKPREASLYRLAVLRQLAGRSVFLDPCARYPYRCEAAHMDSPHLELYRHGFSRFVGGIHAFRIQVA